jgi:tRNA nucleotidyltransferase (CCA-adding enzyme)
MTEKNPWGTSEPLSQRILNALPEAALEPIAAARALAPDLYLVGGTVRDALLGMPLQDVDLLLETDAARLGRALQNRLGGELSGYRAFGTCTLRLPNLVVDIAQARAERYPEPGALPEVFPANVEQDLARRDFSVNAMALRLTPSPEHFFDPYGGLEALQKRELRTLHPGSFAQDPTRILRGARLAGRLGFSFERVTRTQIPSGLSSGVLTNVGPERLKNELELTLAEPQVTPALNLLEECGALAAMFQMRADEAVLADLDRQRRQGPIPSASYLLALLNASAAEAAIRRFHWPRRLLRELQLVREVERGRDLEGAGPAARALLKALGPALRQRVERYEVSLKRRRLRGQDVLDLGLPAGPQVGWVLAQVAKARAGGEADSFEAELALARALVSKLHISKEHR